MSELAVIAALGKGFFTLHMLRGIVFFVVTTPIPGLSLVTENKFWDKGVVSPAKQLRLQATNLDSASVS